MNIYPLDLVGTFAFAAFGAHVALRKNFDVFGILACGFLTAVGGGTLREILLGKTPFYFFDNAYVVAIIVGVCFTALTYLFFDKIQRFMLVIDAIGLSAFALIGAMAAAKAGLGTVAIILFATITAAGGGILRDISVREVPTLFQRELYATPAALLGLLFALFPMWRQEIWFLIVILFSAFALRLASIFHDINLWHPYNDRISLGNLKGQTKKRLAAKPVIAEEETG